MANLTEVTADTVGDLGFFWIPGEYAWRADHAAEYAMIHCIWALGSTQGHGHGRPLLHDRARAPCAYGVFGAVRGGRLLTYHPIGVKDFGARLDAS